MGDTKRIIIAEDHRLFREGIRALLENIPGGDIAEMANLRYDDNPRLFLDTLLAKLERHHPTIYDRIDTARFDLQGPLDLLQGGLVPGVRQSSADLVIEDLRGNLDTRLRKVDEGMYDR